MYDRVSVFARGGTETTIDDVDSCRRETEGIEWLESSLPGIGGGNDGKVCNCERRDATEVEVAAGEAANWSSELPDDASSFGVDDVVASCHA